MGSQSISRRDFLRVAGLSSAALLFGRGLDAFGRRASRFSPRRAQMEPFVPDAEISITAAEKTVQILPGAQTRVRGYEYHCHILSHEEMDMMRPVLLAFPPVAPSNLAFDTGTTTLSWTDSSLSETAFVVQKWDGTTWVTPADPLATIQRPLNQPNTTGEVLSYTDSKWVSGSGVQYRVVAQNTIGDTWDYSDQNLNEIPPGTFAFPVYTVESFSEPTTPQPTTLNAVNGGGSNPSPEIQISASGWRWKMPADRLDVGVAIFCPEG